MSVTIRARRTRRSRTGAAILAVAAAALILATSTVAKPRPDAASAASLEEPPVERYRLGLVHVGQARIDGDMVAIRWLGSGFLVDDECRVATAAHILEGITEERLIVRLFNPRAEGQVHTYSARILYRDPDRDLALIGFGAGQFAKKFCRSEAFLPLELTDGLEPSRLNGQPVWVVGFPVLEREQPTDVPIIRHGHVSSAELEWDGLPMILLDLTGVPGFSGAPVILERTGEVIGLVYGPGRTSRQFDLEWATPMTRADYDRARDAGGNN